MLPRGPILSCDEHAGGGDIRPGARVGVGTPVDFETAGAGEDRVARVQAQLDALTVEPLPRESPLWSLDNAILTPHVSNSSPRVRERSLALVTENVRRFKAGEPLLNLVDRAVGY